MGLTTVRARDGATLVPLLDGEMERLVRSGNQVSARFGPGGAALVATEARWALPLLAEWRGIAFAEGGGI